VVVVVVLIPLVVVVQEDFVQVQDFRLLLEIRTQLLLEPVVQIHRLELEV
jgi:hypothetical protein